MSKELRFDYYDDENTVCISIADRGTAPLNIGYDFFTGDDAKREAERLEAQGVKVRGKHLLND